MNKNTPEKIKLLYLITEYSVGGAEKTMVRILSGFNRDKYDITVVALRMGSGILLPELEKIGIKTEILGAKTKYDFLRVVFRLYKLLRKDKPQILICSLYHPAILGRIIGKLAGTPIIINWEVSENFGGFLRVLLNRITLNLSDKIFCDSKKVSAELINTLGCPDDKIEIAPTGGLDLMMYNRQCKNSDSSVKIGIIGRFTEAKGYEYFVETAKIVTSSRENICFSIVGDGTYFSKIQNMIKEFDLTDKVKLLGYRSDIPDLLSEWDIYVQSSLWEGLCLTVVEAIASGLPVVATNVGGIPESIIDGYNGFLVPPKNPEALAEKIIELIDNPDLREKMGENGRKIAEEKYSLDNMVKKIEELVDSLIEKKAGLTWNQYKTIWELRKTTSQ